MDDWRRDDWLDDRFDRRQFADLMSDSADVVTDGMRRVAEVTPGGRLPGSSAQFIGQALDGE